MTGSRACVCILGCPVDALGLDATVERCAELIAGGGPARQVSVNAAKFVSMRDDPALRAAVQESEIISADGQSVVWAARLLRRPLPERVAGIDLMHRLLDRAERDGWRVFLLGATQEVLDAVLERLAESHPRLIVVGRHHGYFRETDEDELCAAIRSAGPDLLLVAMSSPRKELWVARHQQRLGVPLSMGVGGAFDVLAGRVRRAPPPVQRAGFEWLFRLLQEPRRLAWRYAATNVRFLLWLGRELILGPHREHVA